MLDEDITGKKIKTKKTCSIFDLTINTNKSLNTRNEQVIERLPNIKKCLRELGEDLLKMINIQKVLIDMPNSVKEGRNVEPRILEYEANGQIESNIEGKGFLHMHLVYSIVHETKIKFDLPLLKRLIYKYLEKCLTFKGKYYKPYVNIKGRKDDAFSMREYVKTAKNNQVELLN